MRQILGIEPLTTTERVVHSVRQVVEQAFPLPAALMRKVSNDYQRKLDFETAKALILDLLTVLSRSAPGTLLPDARVIRDWSLSSTLKRRESGACDPRR